MSETKAKDLPVKTPKKGVRLTPETAVPEINELLSRNLFLEPDLKKRVLEADFKTQKEVLLILRKMDDKQTDLFRKILEKNPNFFSDLENMAIRDALKKLVAKEETIHLSELVTVEDDIFKTLKTL